MNLSTKQKQITDIENRLVTCWGWGSGGKDWEFGISRSKLYTMDKKQVLSYSTGNYTPHPVISHNGKEHEKNVGGCLEAKSCQTLVTPETVAGQAFLSTGFLRQGYWSVLPFPSPGDLPGSGIEPGPPELQADSLLTEPPWKPMKRICICVTESLCSAAEMNTML